MFFLKLLLSQIKKRGPLGVLGNESWLYLFTKLCFSESKLVVNTSQLGTLIVHMYMP